MREEAEEKQPAVLIRMFGALQVSGQSHFRGDFPATSTQTAPSLSALTPASSFVMILGGRVFGKK